MVERHAVICRSKRDRQFFHCFYSGGVNYPTPIALLNQIGQLPQFFFRVCNRNHVVMQILAINPCIDDVHRAASKLLHNIVDYLSCGSGGQREHGWMAKRPDRAPQP